MLSRKATCHSPVKIVSLSHSSTATISWVGKGTEQKWYMVMLAWFTDKEHNLYIWIKEGRHSSLFEISLSLKSHHVFTRYKLFLGQQISNSPISIGNSWGNVFPHSTIWSQFFKVQLYLHIPGWNASCCIQHMSCKGASCHQDFVTARMLLGWVQLISVLFRRVSPTGKAFDWYNRPQWNFLKTPFNLSFLGSHTTRLRHGVIGKNKILSCHTKSWLLSPRLYHPTANLYIIFICH